MAQKWLGISTTLAALAAITAAASAASRASGGEGGRLRPLPRVLPSVCSCDDDAFGLDEGVARCQLASDFLIALAYFSIPLELLYFFLRSKIFPHRWVLLQFGLFIVLCGLTHFVSIWTYGPHPRSVALTQTILKVLTAAVSCATAFLLVRIIPALLNIKVRELFLQHKAAQLDREMGLIRRQEEVGRHVRMLTHEIRSTLDRHTILNTTLMELAHSLSLDNCTIWMPDPSGSYLELSHELERRLVQVPVRVPSSDSMVQNIISTPRAVRIPADCPLGKASSSRGSVESPMAAVRLPLLQVYDLKVGGSSDESDSSYAIMVLVLAADSRRQWKPHEVEMVEVVADQVAVALSHAAALEESQKTRDALVEQNRALQSARQKAETAVRARNDFLAVMNHEMRTPLQAIIALASILQDGDLTTEQSPMVETVIKSSSLLSTLINDVLEFSRLEEGSLELEMRPFDLPAMLQEAGKLAWPMARSKGLEFSLQVMDGIPQWVVGDEERLLQTTLNVVGHAVKATEKGAISMRVYLDGRETSGDSQQPSWEPIPETRHVFIRFEVHDTGKGLTASEFSNQIQQFGAGKKINFLGSSGGTGLGLAICQKFVELMDGQIWITSDEDGIGGTITYMVRLQVDNSPRQNLTSIETFIQELGGLHVLVVDDNNVNRFAIQSLLETLGCEVTAAESAVECLAELGVRRSHPIDALLLDICMPEIDGFDVARRISQLFRPEGKPLIIGLTARTYKGIREACLEVGMDAVLLKPVSLRELGTTLVELIQANGRPQ